jgi:glycosyltransferase involved in cell wall biosynthesis
VSIIIPCYNQANYLRKTLDHLKQNNLKSWECIIVDDGSNDNSVDIAEIFCNNDKRFSLIKKSNGGSASARNVGLAHAKGEYIQFLDADDFLAPNKIEIQISYMQRANADVSFVDFSFFVNDEDIQIDKFEGNYDYFYADYFWKKMLISWGISFTIPIHAFLYRSSFIREYSLLFDQSLRVREDWGFHVKVAECKANILHLYWISAFYRQGSSIKTYNWVNTSIGNYRFIVNQLAKMKSIKGRFYLLFRLSEENWQTLFRIGKYKFKHITIFTGDICRYFTGTDFCYFLAGILLLPISIFPIVKRILKYYVVQRR